MNSRDPLLSIQQKRRQNLVYFFLLLLLVAIVFIWMVFSDYSNSSRIKKDHYLLRFDLTTLVPGEVRIVRHHGLPVLIMQRTPQELKQLLDIRSYLSDPDSNESTQPAFAKNYYRSLKAEYFIAYAVHPVSANEINYRLASYQHTLKPGIPWYGGFSETHSGAYYDKAGRIYKQIHSNNHSAFNLYVPDYRITLDNQLYVYTLKELGFKD